MKVNKVSVVNKVLEVLKTTGINLTYDQAEKALDASFCAVVETLKEGNEVNLPEIGKFSLDYKKPRKIPEAFLRKAKGGVKNFSGTTAPYVTVKFVPSRQVTSLLTNTPLLMGCYGQLDTEKLQRDVD